jgi:DNA polymerase III epsilon subunit-like protein
LKIIHVVDTETTGFPTDPDSHVVEIAIVTIMVGRGIVSSFSSLMKPPKITPEGIEVCRNVSKIEPDMLDLAPAPADVWRQARSIIEGWGGSVTAWNLGFDRTMLRRTCMGLDEVETIRKNGEACWLSASESKYGWPEVVPMEADPTPWGRCAMWWYASVCPEVRGQHQIPFSETWRNNPWRLANAAEREQVPFLGDAHRALADATVTANLIHKIITEGVCVTSPS